MSRFHNSPSSEKLAMRWHELGFVMSLISMVLSAGGVIWHLQAAREHKQVLEDYSNDDAT